MALEETTLLGGDIFVYSAMSLPLHWENVVSDLCNYMDTALILWTICLINLEDKFKNTGL